MGLSCFNKASNIFSSSWALTAFNNLLLDIRPLRRKLVLAVILRISLYKTLLHIQWAQMCARPKRNQSTPYFKHLCNMVHKYVFWHIYCSLLNLNVYTIPTSVVITIQTNCLNLVVAFGEAFNSFKVFLYFCIFFSLVSLYFCL